MARKNSNFFHWLSIRKLRYEKLKNIKNPKGLLSIFLWCLFFSWIEKVKYFSFFIQLKNKHQLSIFHSLKLYKSRLKKYMIGEGNSLKLKKQ